MEAAFNEICLLSRARLGPLWLQKLIISKQDLYCTVWYFFNLKIFAFPGLFQSWQWSIYFALCSSRCWLFKIQSIFWCLMYDSLMDIFFHPGSNECVWNGINVFELAQRLMDDFCAAHKGYVKFKIGPICQIDGIEESGSISTVPSRGPGHQ